MTEIENHHSDIIVDILGESVQLSTCMKPTLYMAKKSLLTLLHCHHNFINSLCTCSTNKSSPEGSQYTAQK